MRWIVALAFVGVVGCVPPITRPIPSGGAEQTHGRIIVVTNTIGLTNCALNFDGFQIAYMKPGRFLEFFATPGTHSLAGVYQNEAFQIEPKQTYAFELREGCLFRRIEVKDALKAKETKKPHEADKWGSSGD